MTARVKTAVRGTGRRGGGLRPLPRLAPTEAASPAVAQPWSRARGAERWSSRYSSGGGDHGREGTRAGCWWRCREEEWAGAEWGGASESPPPPSAAIGGGLGAGAGAAIGAGAARHGGAGGWRRSAALGTDLLTHLPARPRRPRTRRAACLPRRALTAACRPGGPAEPRSPNAVGSAPGPRSFFPPPRLASRRAGSR